MGLIVYTAHARPYPNPVSIAVHRRRLFALSSDAAPFSCEPFGSSHGLLPNRAAASRDTEGRVRRELPPASRALIDQLADRFR